MTTTNIAAPAEESVELLTCLEVAKLYRVSVNTVRAWARSNRIKSIRISRRVLRFRREDLVGFTPAGAVAS